MMAAIEACGYSIGECLIINEVRLHQQVLYESDIFHADGRTLNKRYLALRPVGQQWSSYRFSLRKPTLGALELWKEALSQIAPGGRRRQGLGRFCHNSHVSWQWRYDEASDIMYHVTPGATTRYRKVDGVRRARHSHYSPDGICDDETSSLLLCSVQQEGDQAVSILSSSPPPYVQCETHPTSVPSSQNGQISTSGRI
jgi:hypothetical protein